MLNPQLAKMDFCLRWLIRTDLKPIAQYEKLDRYGWGKKKLRKCLGNRNVIGMVAA